MLANLLPGVREVRTPLVTGYLWLACLWVLGGSPTTFTASTAGRGLINFLAVAGPWAAAAATTLAAYLTGVLSVAGTSYVVDLVFRRRTRRLQGWISGHRADHFALLGRLAMLRSRIVSGEGVIIRTFDDRVMFEVQRADGSGFRKAILRAENEEAALSLDGAIERFDVWLSRQPNVIELSVVLDSAAYREFVGEYQRVAARLDESIDTAHAEQDANQLVRFSMASEISQRLRDDLPFALTRLIGAEPDLYTAIDRQSTEGEFRAAVSLPLTTLIGAVAVTSQPFILFTLVVPTALFWLGLKRRLDALMTLAQALYAGRVWSPVLGGPVAGATPGPVSPHEGEPAADHDL